jgi:hypothetical protein
MTRHIGPDHRRVAFAAVFEAARVVAHASLGFFRLGVSQQHHAHGFSNDFPRAVV